MPQQAAHPAAVDYAGEIAPAEAWRMLTADADAVLVDVRTQPEWRYVGAPDLSALGGRLITVCWQVYPAMVRNPAFAAQLEAAGAGPGATVLLICRSGVRSRAAARFLTVLGWRACFNVSDGFEGQLDGNRRRGNGGWRAAGLPWVQE